MYRKFKKVSAFLLSLAVAGSLQTANADWRDNIGGISAADPQDVVISMQVNPRKNTEKACLAVTFARSLSRNTNANVTLFVTLDGVSLAKKQVINKRRLMCSVKEDDEIVEITLKENLEAFIGDNQNAMVVCPICWKERYGDKAIPDYGVLPGAEGTPGNAIGALMFNADKILDF